MTPLGSEKRRPLTNLSLSKGEIMANPFKYGTVVSGDESSKSWQPSLKKRSEYFCWRPEGTAKHR
jgi:hypothetical protein